MGERVDVNVLSFNNSDPLTFKRVYEFDNMPDLQPTDYLMVSGKRNGKDITRNTQIKDIAKYMSDVNLNMQWFIPVQEGKIIKWVWSDAVDHIDPIDLTVAAGSLVTQTEDGIMSSTDKVKLDGIEDNANNYVLPEATEDTLGGIKIDGTTLVKNDKGQIVANIKSGSTVTVTEVTLYADEWDTTTKTQKALLEVNTACRNVVDVDVQSINDWTECGVLAITEEADGITFMCNTIPLVNLKCYITSMTIAEGSSGTGGSGDITAKELYKGVTGTGTPENPAANTILARFGDSIKAQMPSGNVSFADYEPNTDIKKNQLVIHDYCLYRATEDITAENNTEWDNDKFELVIGGGAGGTIYEKDGILYIQMDENPNPSKRTIKNGIAYI